LWATALWLVAPSPLGGTVAPVFARPIRGNLEVLAELLVPSLPSERKDVLAQLVPIKVESESVKEERLRDEMVEQKHADLFEEVCEQHVIVWLEALLEESPKCRRQWLAVQHRH